MEKSLVIVESPAKAKTIKKILGKGYEVESCRGHVRDLPQKDFGVDIEAGFVPHYTTIRGRGPTLQKLRKLSQKADAVYLAPDPDREGEAIAWHLAQALELPEEKVRRVTFNEITPSAVREAFHSPTAINLNRVDAQQARRILDRIVGYQLSPLLWEKIYRGLSAGRVQSVAVRLVVEREREIRDFKPREYWSVSAQLSPRDGQPFEAQLTHLDSEKIDLPNEDAARNAVQRLSGATFRVTNVEHKEKREKPQPPFITSTLQQAASSRLSFTSSRTMALAQQLYEGIEIGEPGPAGLITYMRTDSVRVADQAVQEARALIRQQFGPNFLPPHPNVFKSRRGAQEAHEAIRPTSVSRAPETLKASLSPDLLKLYNLVWERFVASQMASAVYQVVNVEITADGGLFKTQGKTTKSPGFRRLTGEKEEENLLPPLSQDQQLDLIQLKPEQHFTKPPNRYSEATLVRALERFGIGRPSTYAPIVSTIQDRGYVLRRGQQLFATRLGEIVTEKLLNHFPDIMDIAFTSHMEEQLDRIEEGREVGTAVLKEFYDPFTKDLELARQEMGKEADTCDLCGAPMTPRKGKFGWFLACTRYPECSGTKPLDAPVLQPGEQTCEKCGKPMVVKVGKHGPFLACSGYPDCDNTQPLTPRRQPQQTKATCEKCGKPMVIRRGKRGPFLACSGYPDCKNTKPLRRRRKSSPSAT